MDQRTIFQDYSELLRLLYSLQGTHASFLVDDDGLTRLDGTITAVAPDTNAAKSQFVLDGTITLHLEQVIAVNGIFRSDYSEC